MNVEIDAEAQLLRIADRLEVRTLRLYSPEAFAVLSRLWLKVGWELKYSYGFSWMGRPVIQLPEDLIRLQEVVYRVRPDVLVETGVAHGGSLIFHASLFRAMGQGRVLGVDIEIRPETRRAVEAHELASLITLVEGDSTSGAVVAQIRAQISSGERVLIVLDSNHGRAHVEAELEAYAPLVSPGCYIVATDGIMEDLYDVPRGRPAWREDNPKAAAAAFAGRHPEFALEEPAAVFNEGAVHERVTYWPGAFLRRRNP